MHVAAITKANFQFRRVRIHIDLPRIDFQKQDIRRMPAMEHDIAKAQPDGACDQAVAEHASI